jgi:alkylresorcinol/alkylpyrone synthase
MPRIQSLATAIPPHLLEQDRARREMARVCVGRPHLERLLPVFDRAGVSTRFLVHPPEWYLEPRSFDERNREYVARGLELAERAARECLARAGATARDVDDVIVVTTTGLATPSLDALLAARLGLRDGVRRWPLFGLGCAGGAGALLRAGEILDARPTGRALVVSVEICSMVFSTQPETATDVVGIALFGDGAAAALLVGDEVPGDGIRLAAGRSYLLPDARHLMGWEFTSGGMRLILSRDIPDAVATRVAPVVEEFLNGAGLCARTVTHPILHPGGPKVMATYRSAFGLPEDAVSLARDSMRRYGNLSSAAVLVMLSDLVASGRPASGDSGLVLALGPGFAAEMLVLRW